MQSGVDCIDQPLFWAPPLLIHGRFGCFGFDRYNVVWVTACGWPWIAAGGVAKAAMEPADLPQNMQTPCERCKEKLPDWARPDIAD